MAESEGEEADIDRYQNINEVPEFVREAFQHLIDKGGLAVPEQLDLTYDMVRLIAIIIRWMYTGIKLLEAGLKI